MSLRDTLRKQIEELERGALPLVAAPPGDLDRDALAEAFLVASRGPCNLIGATSWLAFGRQHARIHHDDEKGEHPETCFNCWHTVLEEAYASADIAIGFAKPAEGGTPSPNPCLYALYAVLELCNDFHSDAEMRPVVLAIEEAATKAYEEALSGASPNGSVARAKEERQ